MLYDNVKLLIVWMDLFAEIEPTGTNSAAANSTPFMTGHGIFLTMNFKKNAV